MFKAIQADIQLFGKEFHRKKNNNNTKRAMFQSIESIIRRCYRNIREAVKIFV